jgi:cyclopropane fatty-acyl-phospholipid synthase-like methyltransferase
MNARVMRSGAPAARTGKRAHEVHHAAPVPEPRRTDAAYYQALHETSGDYQGNNWLVDDLAALTAIGGRSLLEVGCGNGLFLSLAAEHWSDVVGLDWARSPMLDEVLRRHPNVKFVQQGVEEYEPDVHFDLVVSADFFEHLPPALVPSAIRKLSACGHASYHKIACYDDGHSHLSIFRPQRWLQVFTEFAPDRGYRILQCTRRKGRRRRTVVVIANVAVRP